MLPQTAEDAVLLDGDNRSAPSGRSDERIHIERLDRVHADDTG